jgi:hypothetical protein
MTLAPIILGALLILAGPVMLWIALPRNDEPVRPFLRSELAQTLYTLILIISLVFGVAVLLAALSSP